MVFFFSGPFLLYAFWKYMCNCLTFSPTTVTFSHSDVKTSVFTSFIVLPSCRCLKNVKGRHCSFLCYEQTTGFFSLQNGVSIQF